MALLEQPPSPGTRTAALDRVRAALPDLAPAERRVADRLLAEPARAIAMSISEFAELCEVAQPTVSRFCRNVGFPGYPALRLGVANDFAADGHHARQSAPDTVSPLADRLRTDASMPGAARQLRLAPRVEIWPAPELAGAAGVLAAGLAELSVAAACSVVPTHWPTRAHGLPAGSVVVLLAYSNADFGANAGLAAAREAGAQVVYVAAVPSRQLLREADTTVPLPEGPSAELVGLLFADALVEAVRSASNLAGPPGPASPWRPWADARTLLLPYSPDPIPAIHMRAPQSARRGTLVVFYNGFRGNKEQALPPGVAGNRVSPNIVAALLNAGHDVLVPDAPGHGDRKRAWQDVAELHQASMAGQGPDLLKIGRAESKAVIDAVFTLGLATSNDRVAVVGQSWGGMQTLFKLAGDPRPACGAAIMPVCDVTQMAEFADLGGSPRVVTSGPSTRLAPQLAGRPLMIIAGGRDTLTTPEHIKSFVEGVLPAYEAAGVPERLRHLVLDGVGHEFDPRQVDAVLDWLDQYLATA
jgi:DNA-binding MurR/RpiR family transcriptional regulator/dienelactone hydrolase